MDGKDIDRIVKGAVEGSSGNKHPNAPDHEENWARLEAALEEEPQKKRPFLYIAAAAIALLLFSNFYWMLEQRAHKNELSAIVFEYRKKLDNRPPVTTKTVPPLVPETIPDPEESTATSQPETNVVYVDRIVEVPIEIPVYIEVERPALTGSPDRVPSESPSIKEAELPEVVDNSHRKHLIPEAQVSSGKKSKNKKKENQRSFGLKLALNQK